MNKKNLRDTADVIAYKMEASAHLLETAREYRSSNDPHLLAAAEAFENAALKLIKKDAETLHRAAKPSVIVQIIDFLKTC